MAVPTVALSETSPAGSDQINAGDNRIREYKTQNREVMAVDHDYPTSGSTTTAGQHKKVTLQEQADLGTGAVGATIFGSQTIDGKGEAVYTDEDDNDIQMTIKGTPVAINGCAAKTTVVDDDLVLLCDSEDLYKSKKLSISNLLLNFLDIIYPIGSIYTNYSDSTNPGTLLGIGTWVAIAGRVVVGLDGSQTEFDTAGETGGEKTHTITMQELPTGSGGVMRIGTTRYWTAQYSADQDAIFGLGDNTNLAGAGQAHNNLQPYVTCYVWRRSS